MEEAPRLEAPRRTGRRAGLTGAPGVSGEGPAVLRPSCPGQPRTGLSLSGLCILRDSMSRSFQTIQRPRIPSFPFQSVSRSYFVLGLKPGLGTSSGRSCSQWGVWEPVFGIKAQSVIMMKSQS